MNKPPKENARKYASSKKAEYVEITMSSQLLEISDIQDIKREKIFAGNEKIYGWLIFIDENIFANWGHKCKYIFYVDENNIFEKSRLFPPIDNFTMEEV